MKQDPLKKLFEAARKEEPPKPSNTFAQRVVSAISRPAVETENPFFENLALAARRLLVPALALAVMAIAVEFYLPSGWPGSPSDMTQLTEEWWFTLN
jgi:hypothetical protein